MSQAAELRPKDFAILMHYSRALLRVGRRDEAEKVIAQFKALEPEETTRRPYGSLFEFLDLPPEEQFSRYTTNLQRMINYRPEDPVLKVRLGKALLDRGKVQEALEAFRAARQQTSDAGILAMCGKSLLDRDQYGPAREFLEPAVAGDPSKTNVRIDLAIAVFHSQGPEAGLRVLDTMPLEQAKGDYFLLRAQLLDAPQRPQEAAAALNRGIQSSPTRPDLYFQADLFLVHHDQVQQMVDFLARADRVLPNNPQLWLTRAIGLAILHQTEQAATLLTKMESIWPEWYPPYLIHGVILSYHFLPEEAKPLLETAIALGAHQTMAYYHLASAIITADPEEVSGAQAAIRKALALNSKDPYIQSLAGRIACLAKDYAAELRRAPA